MLNNTVRLPRSYFSSERRQVAALSVLALTLVLFSACGNKQTNGADASAAAAPPPSAYPVVTLATQQATLYNDYPATLQGEQNVEIRPKIDGYIEQIYIDEGSVVKKGQTLFRISAPQYQQDVNTAAAAISSAEADVSAAQLQVNKTKPLVEQDIISHYELEAAQYTLQARKAALAQAKASLANARTNLGYTTITSPVNGVAGTIPYKLGSLVSATNAQPLTTISNISHIYAYFSLNEKQLLDFSRQYAGNSMAAKINKMPPVSLVLADGTEYPEKGHVETINGLINTETGSASFRANFSNPLGLIRSGGSATIRVSQAVKDAILVPQKATYELQGKRFVYVADQKGVVKSTEIKIMNIASGNYFVVTEGLKAGDTVVIDGTATLRDGATIKPEAKQPAEVYKNLK